MHYRFTITQREFDTVLAALRYYEAAECYLPLVPMIAAGEHNQPLDQDEIQDLCEYLNPYDPEAHYRLVTDDLVEPVPLVERIYPDV